MKIPNKPSLSPRLLMATIGYFLVMTFLLTINSPGKLITYFFASAGPSINLFARTHQLAIHFLCFYLLSILVCFCFKNASYRIAILFMGAYAIITELVQIPLPNRCSDTTDLLANFAGIACGAITVWAMFHVMLLGHLWKRSSLRE